MTNMAAVEGTDMETNMAAVEGESEEAKTFLYGYRDALRRIENINLKIVELRASQISGAVKYDDMPKAHNITDLSDYAAKLDALEREWKNERMASLHQMEQICKTIDKVPDELQQEVLLMRYISNKTWEEVMLETGLPWRTMHRFHALGLMHIKKIIKCG